jgi:hypothetical protein
MDRRPHLAEAVVFQTSMRNRKVLAFEYKLHCDAAHRLGHYSKAHGIAHALLRQSRA